MILRYHGFVLDSNSNDCATFTIGIDEEDAVRGDLNSLRSRMREEGFYSGIQNFCVGGAKPWDQDQRLVTWLAIKYAREKAEPKAVASEFKAMVSERLAAYATPAPGNENHAAAKLMKGERTMLEAMLA